MSVGAGGIVRGCGTRQAGGIYAVTGMSPLGMPIEWFLLDPPVMVPEYLDVPRRGVTTFTRDEITHVADHVGSEHYPNVADFIEEARRYGLSRRLSKKFDFSQLKQNSRLVLAHSRAYISTWPLYREADTHGSPFPCPKWDVLHEHREGHISGEAMCADLWWRDIEGGTPTGELLRGQPEVSREMPAGFSYTGVARPEGLDETGYRHAFFMTVPIERIEVVRDTMDRSNEARAIEAAHAAGLPVDIVDL